MKKVFLVSLVGEGGYTRRSILGFINSNNSEVIATYIKNKYNLILGEQYQASFIFEIGIHWEYTTNRPNVDVHVDVVNNLEDLL